VAASRQQAGPASAEVPQLRFSVEGAQSVRDAAVPTVQFELRIDAEGQAPIRSVMLDAQIQIEARRRGYDTADHEQLRELFGTPDRWGATLRTLPWIRTTVVVPPFDSSTRIALSVPCSYDLEVSGSRYFAGLRDGAVPLEFLFSGSVFYTTARGMLQTARIPWDSEVRFAMPVAVWRHAIDAHFPGSAWLRLARRSFDALCSYKAQHAFASWDEAIGALLAAAGDR